MYTRIIQIEGRLDPIAINITHEKDHDFIDEYLCDYGAQVVSDETLDMPGATRGMSLVDGLYAIRNDGTEEGM